MFFVSLFSRSRIKVKPRMKLGWVIFNSSFTVYSLVWTKMVKKKDRHRERKRESTARWRKASSMLNCRRNFCNNCCNWLQNEKKYSDKMDLLIRCAVFSFILDITSVNLKSWIIVKMTISTTEEQRKSTVETTSMDILSTQQYAEMISNMNITMPTQGS